jgi:hypothetical protein
VSYRSLVELKVGVYALYGSATAQLYTPPRWGLPGGPGPLPPGSEDLFVRGPIIIDPLHPSRLISQLLPGGLIERFDLSGHGNIGPHINYDLYGASGDFTRKALGDEHIKKIDPEK